MSVSDLPPVLTLDGPSGAGKGTIGQLCSLKFGWHYLDSGAIYRGLAWLAQDQKWPLATLVLW